eukprot:scaffold14039_cov37-Tisochrysis_lutea.AAC.5
MIPSSPEAGAPSCDMASHCSRLSLCRRRVPRGRRCPEVQEYKLYYAQSLFKAGLYEPAMKACQNVDDGDESERGRVLKLQVRRGVSERCVIPCSTRVCKGAYFIITHTHSSRLAHTHNLRAWPGDAGGAEG